ncbi:NAD-dependent epimerase/dehydratase family protein [Kineococcus sp. SYSU DK005]|uniref:NAD-dependent epimerase/dehydratase family protein n=1 Tax=Kineococcus sp. SYSU DK005 TaxID=3383126 RepID=UPI003D7D1FD5
MQRVLVTGGAGFIGRAVSSAFLARSVAVDVVDDLRVAPLQQPLGNLMVKSVLDMDESDLDGVEVVYHLASHKSVPESFDRPLEYLDNIDSGRHLLRLCAASSVSRVIIGSTCEVYGNASMLPSAEHSPMSPMSPYAASKVALEMLARAHQQSRGQVEVTIARLFNVFGPGERTDALVPRLCHSALVRAELPIEGSGLQRRDLSYVDDTVDKLVALARGPYVPVVNVGSGRSWSVRDVALQIQQLAADATFVDLPGRRNEIAEFCADTSVMDSLHPRARAATPVPIGIARTFDWWSQRTTGTSTSHRSFEGVAS